MVSNISSNRLQISRVSHSKAKCSCFENKSQKLFRAPMGWINTPSNGKLPPPRHPVTRILALVPKTTFTPKDRGTFINCRVSEYDAYRYIFLKKLKSLYLYGFLTNVLFVKNLYLKCKQYFF